MKHFFLFFIPFYLLSNNIAAANTLPPPHSYDWGVTGHRVIGEVANSYLKRKTKRKIKAILGNESIAISSNWADFIKSDSTMNYLNTWHYVNVKGGMNAKEFSNYLKNDTITDAFTKLNFMINALKDKNLAMDKKQMYLRLVIHILGDIHQPMHVGHAEDQGGNRIKVMWFNEPTNLHALWDDKLIEFQKLSYTEYCQNINHAEPAQIEAWQKQTMPEWFYESYQLADKIYGDIKQPDQKLGYRYNYDYVALMNEQLLKGGVRLAGVLNEIFK